VIRASSLAVTGWVGGTLIGSPFIVILACRLAAQLLMTQRQRLALVAALGARGSLIS